MPHYPQLIAEELKRTPNRNLVNKDNEAPIESLGAEEGEISSYETRNGVPYLAHKLDLKVPYHIDERMATKIKVVEDYIRESVLTEGGRDSVVSYENIMNRITARLPESLERMVLSKRGDAVLEFMFREIALQKGLSGETYLKSKATEIKKSKVESLKRQLKEALAT